MEFNGQLLPVATLTLQKNQGTRWIQDCDPQSQVWHLGYAFFSVGGVEAHVLLLAEVLSMLIQPDWLSKYKFLH
jgi:hypothetical protein